MQAPFPGDQVSTELGNEAASEVSIDDMQSSRSTSAASKNTPADDSTVKLGHRRGSRKLTWDKLRAREIRVQPSEDARLPDFEALFHPKLPKLDSERIQEVRDIFDAFLQLSVAEVDYTQIESLSNDFDRWKSQVSLARISEEHFSGDITRCTFSNEALLQRTVMIEIIDRHQLHRFLTFNSEGQWDQHDNDRLLSKDSKLIKFPKPDLNMSFQLESFDEMAAIPPALEKSFRPDSLGQMYGRCFPFLFFEVKRACEKLELAEMANLNSASQALLNIYAWMTRAQNADTFFKEVRVFSFVFNAQDLSVRVHRATAHPVTVLQYHFEEVVHINRYSKNQACLLIKKVLQDYAIKELHPLLKSAFDTVTEEYSKEIMRKRSTQFARTTATARAQRRASTPIPEQNTQSFGLSTLAT